MNKLFRKRLTVFVCLICLLIGTSPVSATGANSTVLHKKDIRDILYGACFLGAGGGGKLEEGLTMLDNLPDDAAVELLKVEGMDSDKYGAVTAMMGAPSSVPAGEDLTPYTINAFDALSVLASKMPTPKQLSYSLVGELGGSNTMVPISVAYEKGIPLIDADGCGRACPTLECCLFNVNGQTTAPVVLADGGENNVVGEGNISVVNTKNPYDAKLCEQLSRVVTTNYKYESSGFACWMHKQSEIQSTIANGTISAAREIGNIFTSNIAAKTPQNIFPSIDYKYEIKRLSQVCKITSYTLDDKEGFDKGTIEFQDVNDPGKMWKVYFQNENLIIWKKYKGYDADWVPLMTAPDSIMYYDASTGMPYCSADLAGDKWKNVKLTLCLMPVAQEWWLGGDENAYQYWKPLISKYYDGDVLKYVNLPVTVGDPINTTYYQAEDVDDPDTGCQQYLPGYRGNGHVISEGDSVDDMIFNINVPEAGNYDITFRYSQIFYGGFDPVERSVTINNNTSQSSIVSFPDSFMVNDPWGMDDFPDSSMLNGPLDMTDFQDSFMSNGQLDMADFPDSFMSNGPWDMDDFPYSSFWDSLWNEVTITKQLNAGSNTITISSDNYPGDVYIDRLKLTLLP